jgi:hypothetical protein
VSCRSCESKHQTTFLSEINIHIPGFHNLSTKPVWAFPKLLVCLDCGFTELRFGRAELCELEEGIDAQENAA